MDTTYATQDPTGLEDGSPADTGPSPMRASRLLGHQVHNKDGESLGHVQDFMIDLAGGRIGYVALAFRALPGQGDKLFAVAWAALQLEAAAQRFLLHVPRAALADAPGFDSAHWPSTSDPTWASGVHKYYTVRRTGPAEPSLA
jgi:sporulation protein YlmC with PRC-barrel domain